MKFIIATISIFSLFGLANADNFHGSRRGGSSHGGGSHSSAPSSHSAFNPPKYNRPAPVPAHAPAIRTPVPVRHDSIGNRVTEDHMSRVTFSNTRVENVMRNNPHVNDIVRIGRTNYANHYRPDFEQKRVFFNDYVGRYNRFVVTSPAIVSLWHRHHFWGGFYYGFHPIVDIDSYFYDPSVFWFYTGTFDDGYYRTWYADSYDTYPAFHEPFKYHGVYYPTENLRQLLFGVSAMPADKQAAFRSGMIDFTQRLAQNMANGLGTRVVLTKGDAVITHYEILGYDDGVVLEGMVTYKNQAYNFRGLLDMEHPEQSMVFVPATWDKNPTPQQLAELDGVNAHIDAMKGVPPATTANAEAEPDPAEIPPAPPAGEAIAEPQKM